MSVKMKKAFLLNGDKEYKIFYPKGCEKCNHTGYKGRVVISEVLLIDQEMKDVISTKPTITSISKIAKKNGFVSMQIDAILKIVKGITSFEEVQKQLKEIAKAKK